MGVKMPDLQKLMDSYTRLAEDDMQEIATQCCEAGQKILFEAMTENIHQHITKGRKTRKGVYKGGGSPMHSPVSKSPVLITGTGAWCATGVQNLQAQLFARGANGKMNNRGLWYREYGGKGWKPPEPWFRPAVDSSRPKILKEWKSIMESHGLVKK